MGLRSECINCKTKPRAGFAPDHKLFGLCIGCAKLAANTVAKKLPKNDTRR